MSALLRVLLFPAERGGRRARRRRPAPVPAERRRLGPVDVSVLGHVDLDPLRLDRIERLGDVALAHRVREVPGERIIGQLDDQGVRVAVVVLAAIAPERDPLHTVDLVEQLVGLAERRIDLLVGRSRLELEQHDVLDHLVASSRIGRFPGAHAIGAQPPEPAP